MDTDTLYAPYADDAYRAFSEKLSKNHDLPYRGVRIPILRKLSKELEDIDFVPRYHEDILLRGFWIASRKLPFSEKIPLIRDHLEYLSTWDEVDTLAASIKLKRTEIDEAYVFFISLLDDERTMPRRLGIVSLMTHRSLFAEKRCKVLDAIAASDSDEYYISMAVAWAFSFFYIDDRSTEAWFDRLSEATLRRTWQKIRDSRRC